MDTVHIIQETASSNASALAQRRYKLIHGLQCNRAAKKISKTRTLGRKKARRSKLAFTSLDTTNELWTYNFINDSVLSEEPFHVPSDTDTDSELYSDSENELSSCQLNDTVEFPPSTDNHTPKELCPVLSSAPPHDTTAESELLSNAIERGDIGKLFLVFQKTTTVPVERFWFAYEEEIFRSLQLCQNNAMFDILRKLGAFRMWTNHTWYKYLRGGYEMTFRMAMYFYGRPSSHELICGCWGGPIEYWNRRGRKLLLCIIDRCGSSFARRLMKEKNIEITLQEFLFCGDEEEALCWLSVLDSERLKDPKFHTMDGWERRDTKYNWIGFHVLCSHEGFTKEVGDLEWAYNCLLLVFNHASPACECLRLHWMRNALRGIFMPFGARICSKNSSVLFNPISNWEKLVTYFLTVECGFENGICVDVDGIIREFVGCGFLVCVDEDMTWGEFLSALEWYPYSGEFSDKFLAKSAREMICLTCEDHGFETMSSCCA